MDECVRCQRNKEQVKLVDAILDGEIAKICEECAVLENIPIIRKPTSYQLEASEKPYSVRQRLAKMAGVKLKEDVQDSVKRDMKAKAGVCEIKGITLDKLRPVKDYSKLFKKRQELVKKSNQPIDLVDNWNWHVQMARRNRKITLSQLSNLIGESELTLKIMEQGELPDDALRIIVKLEQFFKIRLRKSEAAKEQNRIQQATRVVREPVRVLSFDKVSLQNLTLADLKRMKDERERDEREDWKGTEKLAWGGGTKEKEKKEKKDKSVVGSDIEIIEDG